MVESLYWRVEVGTLVAKSPNYHVQNFRGTQEPLERTAVLGDKQVGGFVG